MCNFFIPYDLFDLFQEGAHYGRRRCKSEGLESDQLTNGCYEQSYSAEIQRPLSKVSSQKFCFSVIFLRCEGTLLYCVFKISTQLKKLYCQDILLL